MQTAHQWAALIIAHAGIALTVLVLGALIITGLFTLLPGRLIGNAVWDWLGA